MTALPIFEQVPEFDASTHRVSSSYTDIEEPGRGRVRRVWGLEPIPSPEVSAALKGRVADAVQRHLDAAVAQRNYASAAAAVSYVGDPNPQWDAEGRAVRAWRSAVWEACFAALDDVLAGKRVPLTPEQMVSELPPLVWPE